MELNGISQPAFTCSKSTEETPGQCVKSVKVTGTVVQIEKALTNDRLRVSKVSGKSRIPTIYNFAAIYP